MKRLIRFAGIIAGIGAAIWLMKDRFLQIPEHGDGEIAPFRVPSTDGNGAKDPAKLIAADTKPPADATGGDEGDDLTEINGIGPVYSRRLVALGVTTFSALAKADSAELAEHLNVTPRLVEDWVEQARDRA